MQDATTANLLRQLDDPTKGQPWQTIPHAASGVKSQTLGPEGGQLQSSQNTLGSIGAAGSGQPGRLYGGRLASGTGLGAASRGQINQMTGHAGIFALPRDVEAIATIAGTTKAGGPSMYSGQPKDLTTVGSDNVTSQ